MQVAVVLVGHKVILEAVAVLVAVGLGGYRPLVLEQLLAQQTQAVAVAVVVTLHVLALALVDFVQL
jgi:hypothetical protein